MSDSEVKAMMTSVPHGTAAIVVNPELADYLKSRPPLRPLIATLKDATLPANIIGFLSTALTLPSAWLDPVNGTFRALQGVSALVSITIQTYMQLKGRYQTYQDLRDLQKGYDPSLIVARADMKDKSDYSRFESWWMANSVDITAWWAIGNCGLMAASGIASERPGETATAVLWAPSYMLRLLPEKSSSAETVKKTAGVMEKVATSVIAAPFNLAAKALSSTGLYKSLKESWLLRQPPLVLSALYNIGVKRVPALANSIYAGDIYATGWMMGGVAQDILTAEIDKRCIGRGHGSIVNHPDGHVIARNIIEGRGWRSFKDMIRPRPSV
ncbi:MAG: hypothetical protein HYS17_10870 [Micavibrio aeruginosavorus]|uniref:Uncharacterized protein n=1 Tax=Micavibrio aeruginosavorus TaxID=349221 RepID=A0A7T5UGK3_9BACT|nr:MAG: hypothetical protein HYS17_10870 [Micavibrio aeruginosavorus]